MSEAKMTGRNLNKPGCATVRNQATALFSLPMRLGQHVVRHFTYSNFFLLYLTIVKLKIPYTLPGQIKNLPNTYYLLDTVLPCLINF